MHLQAAFAGCSGAFELQVKPQGTQLHCPREVPLPADSNNGSVPSVRRTEQPLRLTPCTRCTPTTPPHDTELITVSPLQPPYLTAQPSAGSSLEGEITPRSQTSAGPDVPQGCGALRIHPRVCPPQILIESFPRGGRDQRCPSHGDVSGEVSVLTVTHGLGVSSCGRLALPVGTHGKAH